MLIGIDIRCLIEGARTGVEEYTIAILERLANDNENEYILFINSFKEIKTDLSWLENKKNIKIRRFHFPNKLINFSMWFFDWPKIDQLIGEELDVFFAPNISFLSLSKKCKFILTIHDLSFERFPEYFSLKRNLWHFILNPRKICQRADKILAVSDSTKYDLLELYKIKAEKVKVANPVLDLDRFINYNADSQRTKKIIEKYKLPSEFILFLGTIEPRKNIISLVKAFEELKQDSKFKNGELKLVIAGRVGWSFGKILRVIFKSRFKQDIILTGAIDDEDKPCIYKLAKVFVYPSFFEGFGFPPVEAMASGTPTITSNCSSLPEVVKDGAILIDPSCPYDIALAIQVLLTDKRLCQLYIEKGVKRVNELKTHNKFNLKIWK